jgi:hypothetical protein
VSISNIVTVGYVQDPGGLTEMLQRIGSDYISVKDARVLLRTADPSIGKCERCCGTGVLVGFTSPDRPCGCVPVKSEGPSEWEVVERGVVQYDNSFTIVVQKSTARASFMIYPTTNGTMVFDASSRQIKQVGVNREYAPEMALARLLCALRDGSVKP